MMRRLPPQQAVCSPFCRIRIRICILRNNNIFDIDLNIILKEMHAPPRQNHARERACTAMRIGLWSLVA